MSARECAGRESAFHHRGVYPRAWRAAADAPQAQMMILPHISRFGIFIDPAAIEAIIGWLRTLTQGAGVGQ
jgi:hypothetical protein